MSESAVTLTVNLVGSMATSVDFEVTIEAQIPGADPVTAQTAMEAAHAVCPYSRATRGNIAVVLSVVTDED